MDHRAGAALPGAWRCQPGTGTLVGLVKTKKTSDSMYRHQTDYTTLVCLSITLYSGKECPAQATHAAGTVDAQAGL
jgi:hypothetical protein